MLTVLRAFTGPREAVQGGLRGISATNLGMLPAWGSLLRSVDVRRIKCAYGDRCHSLVYVVK